MIERRKTQTNELHPYRILALLIELYNNAKYRDKLPAILDEHLEEPVENYRNLCLTGDDDVSGYFTYICLKFELDTKHEDSNKVLLTNISYNRESIKGEIELNAEEFFFILVNLSVELLAKFDITLDKIEIDVRRRREDNTKKRNIIRSDYFRLDDIAFDYLMYIKEELKEERIKPIEILRNSGINTLILLKEEESVTKFINEALNNIQLSSDHTKNHKLIVDCFYECLRYD
ncbi:MAG: hypothetical protein KGD64_01565 [Candidatus Heimdallarchaeota archaeon]|nr:hypothetical protein [Candidatus Heimdallarchaeota archaeon]